MFQLIRRYIKLFQYFFISFKYLYGIPSLLFLRHGVESRLLYMGKGMFHTAVKLMQGNCFFTRRGYFHRLLSRLGNSVSPKSRYFAYGNAQFLFQSLCIYFIAVFLYDVHHVHCHNDGYAQFRKLRRKVEVSFYIRSVYYVQYYVGSFVYKIISCHYLLQGIGRKRIYTRQVCYDYVFTSFKFTLFFLYGYPGPVAHKLIGTR